MAKSVIVIADLKYGSKLYRVDGTQIKESSVTAISHKSIEHSDYPSELRYNDDQRQYASKLQKEGDARVFYLNKIDALQALDKALDERLQLMLKEREDFIIKLTGHYDLVRRNDKAILEEEMYIKIK